MRTTLIALMLCLTSCEKAPEPPKPPSALEQFKALSSLITKHLHIELDGKILARSVSNKPNPLRIWDKIEVEDDTVTIDVQKTDSLISPFIGTYIFSDQDPLVDENFFDRHRSKPKLYPAQDDTHHYRLTFAYQDDKWVSKEMERTVTASLSRKVSSKSLITTAQKDNLRYIGIAFDKAITSALHEYYRK